MKKILIISLALALALTLVLPSLAMASPASFSATGTLTSIDTGNVKPLGNTGRWLVLDRHIQGQFQEGNLGSSTDFTLTYNGIFELSDQSGNLQGMMQAGTDTFQVTAVVAPLTFVSVESNSLPKLSITGQWKGINGIHAKGNFTAWLIFIPTPEGHVGSIVESSFNMEGYYLP